MVTEVFLLFSFVTYVHPGALFIFHFLYDFNSSQICSSHIRFSLIWLLITLDLFAASTWTICDSKFVDGVLMPYKFSAVYSGTDLNLLIWIILVIILFDSIHRTFYLFNLIYLIIALWYVGCLGQDTCRWRQMVGFDHPTYGHFMHLSEILYIYIYKDIKQLLYFVKISSSSSNCVFIPR